MQLKIWYYCLASYMKCSFYISSIVQTHNNSTGIKFSGNTRKKLYSCALVYKTGSTCNNWIRAEITTPGKFLSRRYSVRNRSDTFWYFFRSSLQNAGINPSKKAYKTVMRSLLEHRKKGRDNIKTLFRDRIAQVEGNWTGLGPCPVIEFGRDGVESEDWL